MGESFGAPESWNPGVLRSVFLVPTVRGGQWPSDGAHDGAVFPIGIRCLLRTTRINDGTRGKDLPPIVVAAGGRRSGNGWNRWINGNTIGLVQLGAG